MSGAAQDTEHAKAARNGQNADPAGDLPENLGADEGDEWQPAFGADCGLCGQCKRCAYQRIERGWT
ncbi:hypothetical protein AB4874_14900 [Thioclava sp. 15-R06ZXC-3]|uniref:Uncharacterized protein n=1 Tax=Thioclava arctica TaxID=3238301 RepID=A0ABV3TPL6_9RHOB